MTDLPPPPTPEAEPPRSIADLMRDQQSARARYDDLNHAINALFAQYGTSDRMPAESVARYRQMQTERDDAYSTMRALEAQMSIDADLATEPAAEVTPAAGEDAPRPDLPA